MRLITGFFAAALLTGHVHADANWPRFLGPNDPGHAKGKNIPIEFTEGKDVRWKVAIPGEGWSSPVVLGKQVWMATATEEGKSLRAVCVERETGKLLHNIELFRVDAPAPKHALNSHASPTPVLEDGRAYFAFGMYGAACLDTKSGKIVWKNTDLPHDHGGNGPGSSPIIYKNLFILNCDGTELRYVVALDKKTGKQVWKTERSNDMSKSNPQLRKAYATPLLIKVNGQDQIVSPGGFRLSTYDPNTGKELWWVDIPGFSNVQPPVYANGLLYVSTGFNKAQLWAIKPDGKGDVTNTHVAWKYLKGVPNKPTPMILGKELFMVSDDGIVTCLDAITGEEIWKERIGGAYSASPLYVEGRLYLFSHTGEIVVLQPGRELKILAKSTLGDGFMASPAVVDDALILRSKTHLYRIQK